MTVVTGILLSTWFDNLQYAFVCASAYDYVVMAISGAYISLQ